jgi:hypothetical protein
LFIIIPQCSPSWTGRYIFLTFFHSINLNVFFSSVVILQTSDT